MYTLFTLLSYFLFYGVGTALRYEQQFIGHNLNQNETAINPLDYDGSWANHTYFPSPDNWRFPVYTVCPITEFEVRSANIFAAVPGQIRKWRSHER